MTISVANQSIKLDVHSPKKASVVATGAPVPAATEIAIWAGADINPGLVQSIVGGFQALHAYAQTELKNITATVQMPLGGGSGSIEADGTPGAGDLVLYVGSDVVAKQQSHFLDRTFKRLIEVWLEGEVGIAVARILAVGNNFTFNGRFAGGQAIEVVIQLTDPDGDVEEDVLNLTLPPAPGGFHLGPVAAAVVCARIDALTHIRCEQVDNMLSITPSAPANTLTVSIRLA